MTFEAQFPALQRLLAGFGQRHSMCRAESHFMEPASLSEPEYPAFSPGRANL
jgi:hypothetical protein